MTNFNGQIVLDSIINQDYIINNEEAENFDNEMAVTLVENLSLDRINKSSVTINNGVENNRITIALEIAPNVLPLKYVNEYKKLIRPEDEIEPIVLLVYESENISKSHMKMENITSLSNFIDNKSVYLSDLKNRLTELYELDLKLTVENKLNAEHELQNEKDDKEINNDEIKVRKTSGKKAKSQK
ncbi:MAG: hypothetical protein LBC17_00435 [Lactobacillaceae bacterium]|jgi:hypothetical protein|nr:hypothetical protein [Lactobacillaceae bacterium]